MRTKYFLPFLLAVFTLFACDKMPENGDLDGQWQMTSIKHLRHEAPTPALIGKVYWSFQLKLLSIYTPKDLHNQGENYTFCRFQVKGDSLHITKSYVHSMNTDIEMDETATYLDVVGLHNNRESYAIKTLTDSRLVLHSDYHELEFRKW